MKEGVETGPYGVVPDKELAGAEDRAEVPGYEIVIEQGIDIEEQSQEAGKEDKGELASVRAQIDSSGVAPASRYADLPAPQRAELELEVRRIKKGGRFSWPALSKGNKTATEYDSKVGNYSTITNIVPLAGGRKLFVVYNYPASWMHRTLDGLMKRLTGCRMKKAKSSEWKEKFESKSRIPTIPCEDDNTVVMPFLPNINVYDLFANRGEIQNFGECDFAREMDSEGLLTVVDKIVAEVKDTHAQGVTWGELIPQNIILDKDQIVHICDPETSYDADVSLVEQKARDLLDLITSIAAALEKSGVEHKRSVARVLDNYQDAEVVAELQKLAAKQPGVLARLCFGYTKARLGLKDKQQWQQIKETIASYETLS